MAPADLGLLRPKMMKSKPSLKMNKKKTKHVKVAARKPVVADKVVELVKLKGKGDYFGDLLGGLGSKVGQWAGNSLQNGFRKLTGFGDYRTDGPVHNSLVKKAAHNAPSEAPFQMGAMDVKFSGAAPRVQHREFIGPVTSTGSAFSTKAYRIQPGLQSASLFPWGSSVAKCFQQYILHGCVLEFVSTSSEYAANSALGSVMMSTIYDPSQPLLANAQAVNNNDYTTVAKPSVSFYHPLECASKDSQVSVRYVTSLPPSASDTRLTDVGTFQLSTLGLTAPVGSEIGELWCTYDIEFLKAELPDLHADASASFVQTIVSGSAGAWTPNINNTFPVSYSGGIFQLPAGYTGSWVLIGLTQQQGAASANFVIGTLGSEVSGKQIFLNSVNAPNSSVFSTTSATTATSMMAFAFTTQGLTGTSANSIQLNPSTGAGLSANIQFVFLPVNKALNTALTLLDEEDRVERLERMVEQLSRPLRIDVEQEEEKSDFELLQLLRSNKSAISAGMEHGPFQKGPTK